MNAISYEEDMGMSPWFDTFWARYGSILVGIGIGTAAKWALVMAEGRNLTWRTLAIDMLLAPMVALLAVYGSVKFGMDPHTSAMLGALMSIASDRVVRLVRIRFLQKVDQEFEAYAQHARGVIRQEVQTEMSGKELISDVISGTAPDFFKASKARKLD